MKSNTAPVRLYHNMTTKVKFETPVGKGTVFMMLRFMLLPYLSLWVIQK